MKNPSSIRGVISDVVHDPRRWMLLAVASGWSISMGARMVYPIMIPHIRDAYEMDLTTAGLLLTALWIAYAVGQLPGGLLTDRVGEGTVLAASMFLSAAALVLVATARTTEVLFFATLLFGFGTGFYGVARFTALVEVFPDKVGAVIGLVSAAGDLGNSLLPPIVGLVTAAVAWQYGLGLPVPLFVLFGVAIWVTVPGWTTAGSSARDGVSSENARYVLSRLRNPLIIYGTVIEILGVSVWQAFTGFYPTYLIEVKGLSAPVAGGVFGLFFALGVLVKPLAGAGYDRIGIRRSLVVVAVVGGLALAVLPFVDGFVPLLVTTAFVSLILGRGTITQSYLTERLPSDVNGTGLGILRTVITTLGAASPVLFGAAADRGFFDEGFIVLAALSLLIVPLSLRFPPLGRARMVDR